jgi:hypothetical protein
VISLFELAGGSPGVTVWTTGTWVEVSAGVGLPVTGVSTTGESVADTGICVTAVAGVEDPEKLQANKEKSSARTNSHAETDRDLLIILISFQTDPGCERTIAFTVFILLLFCREVHHPQVLSLTNH